MIIDTPTQHPFKHTSSLTAISSPEINSSSTSQGIRFPIQDLQTSHYSPPPSNGHSTQHHLNLASLPLSFPKFREARQVAYASRARSKSRPGSPRTKHGQANNPSASVLPVPFGRGIPGTDVAHAYWEVNQNGSRLSYLSLCHLSSFLHSPIAWSYWALRTSAEKVGIGKPNHFFLSTWVLDVFNGIITAIL
jgi:hypothetical protein